jgi:DNA polymerase III psi subunit
VKYKIYKVKHQLSTENESNVLLIIQKDPLQPDALDSLRKLVKACKFDENYALLITNNEKDKMVNAQSLFSNKMPEMIWFFGFSPAECGYPISTPTNRFLQIIDKTCMFWPSYNTIATNDQLKRSLWQEIQIIMNALSIIPA